MLLYVEGGLGQKIIQIVVFLLLHVANINDSV